jgi:hypothetical protein
MLSLQIGSEDDFKLCLLTGVVPPGATFNVVSSDPANVAISIDPTPLPVANGEGGRNTPPILDGTPSLISGTVTAVAGGSAPNVPVTITFSQTAPNTADLVITDTVTPVQTESFGDLFGTPFVAPTLAGATKGATVVSLAAAAKK